MQNDEIKEILDDLLFTTTLPNVSIKLNKEKLNQLKDYITKLQQENEKLIKENEKWFAVAKDFEMEAHDLWFKNNELEEAQKNFEKQFIKEMDYKSRIDKAIEELELWNPKNKVIQLEIELLLNILRGEDK